MKFIYALIGMMVWVMPCGAVTTFSFEQDDERGVALRIVGEGQPVNLFPQRLPRPWEFLSVRSPSGLWDFEAIGLAANLRAEEGLVHMSFLVVLDHAGFESPISPHGFDEYLSLDGPLFVREPGWDGVSEAFLGFDVDEGNFLRIDSRPDPLDVETWKWTAFFDFRERVTAVPDAGSTLGMLVMALGGFGLMRRRA